MSKLFTVSSLVAAAGLCAGVHAQITFPEAEANDTKAAANGPFLMTAGDMIVGNSTGTSTTTPGAASADNFLVQTADLAPGIYRHRLVITTAGTAGHIGTIRGLTQTFGSVNAGTDAIVQTSTTGTPPRTVQWYGFGAREQVYFRVTGTSSTTADYTATLETISAPIVDAGTYFGGSFTISRAAGNTTDVDFWLYDSNFIAIAGGGNDIPDTLTRTLTPGTYYIAWSNTNVASNQPAPADDARKDAIVMDSAGAVTNSVTTTATNLGIRIADAYGPVDTAASKSGAFDVVWIRLTVDNNIPATNGACCLADGTCQQMRPASCTLAAGTYSGDGVACASVSCPQPGGCCIAAFSCPIVTAARCTTLGGVYQGNGVGCAPCPHPPAGSVAIYGADTTANINDVKAKLDGTALFPGVAIGNATTMTPSLEELLQYKAVLIWSNNNFSDQTALGNVMADYIDAGGGVVNSVFSVTTQSAARYLRADWDATYQILQQNGGNTNTGGEQFLGTIAQPGHPILAGVTTFGGGASSFRPVATPLTPHGELVAQWSDGKMLIATSSTRPRRVDLGFFPPSTTATTTGWNQATDGARLMANALLYAGRDLNVCYPNCDSSTVAPILNVQDFSCFLNRFAEGNTYANCDGSTTPPILNVQDFSCFLNAFAVGCS